MLGRGLGALLALQLYLAHASGKSMAALSLPLLCLSPCLFRFGGPFSEFPHLEGLILSSLPYRTTVLANRTSNTNLSTSHCSLTQPFLTLMPVFAQKRLLQLPKRSLLVGSVDLKQRRIE